MPFVPDNSAQDTANLIELVRMNRERKRSQYKTILEMAAPGQTAEDLGITPQQYKEATGNELKPGTVLKPETATDKLDKGVRALLDSWKADPSIIDKATPGSLEAIYTGRLAQTLGLSGDTTGPGLKAQQQAAQTRSATGATVATTQSDLITAGADAWRKTDAATKGTAGQQLGTGMTTASVQSTDADQLLNVAMKKQGLKMVSDPNNPAWAPIKALGISPVMAVSATATGMLPLLDQYAQMFTAVSIGRSQAESELSKINAQWAGKVSETLGGSIPPGVIMKVMNDRLAGNEASGTPQAKAVAALIDQATGAAFQAVLMDNFSKGDPYAKALPELLKAASGKLDAGQFNILSDQINTVVGRSIATSKLGPNPMDGGPKEAAWDSAARAFANLAPHDHTWFQKLLSWPAGDPNQAPGAKPTGAPASPVGGAAPGVVPAPPAPGLSGGAPTAAGPGGMPGKVPSINDLTPDQQASVRQILGILAPPQPAGAGAPPSP